MAKVSIIVPIYNVEQYIDACLKSLLSQNYDDYQILCINDGSKQNEQPVIDSYVAQYPLKVRSVIKENGGYGSVLQMGIEICNSPYFLVCDPDDTLTADCLSTLVSLIEAKGCDIAVGCKNYVYHGDDKVDYHQVYNKDYVSLKDGQVGHIGNSDADGFYFMDPSPHAKLYKTSLYKGVVFPTKISYTDNLLYYYGLCHAQSVVYTSKALSNYLIDRPGNSMSNIKLNSISANQKVFDTIFKQCESLKDSMLMYRLFESYKWLFYRIASCDGSDAEKKEMAKSLWSSFAQFQPYSDAVLAHYKQYSKAKLLEKINDKKIIQGNQGAYSSLVKKVYGE